VIGNHRGTSIPTKNKGRPTKKKKDVHLQKEKENTWPNFGRSTLGMLGINLLVKERCKGGNLGSSKPKGLEVTTCLKEWGEHGVRKN